MKRVVLLAACVLLVAGCASSATDELAAKDRQIADLLKQNTELKQELSRPQSCPNPGEMVAGQGDGHFTVMPAKLRPGEAVAVYTATAARRGKQRLRSSNNISGYSRSG